MCDSEQLIALVEKHPCLWNAKHADYANREVKELAWEQVCKGVFVDWDGADEDEKRSKAAETKKRWGNIRDCYRKDHNRRKGQPSVLVPGSGLKKALRRYVYAELLTFLDPVFDTKTSAENSFFTNDDSLNGLKSGEYEVVLPQIVEVMSSTVSKMKRPRPIVKHNNDSLSGLKPEEYEVIVPQIVEVMSAGVSKTEQSRPIVFRETTPDEATPSKREKAEIDNDDDDLKFLLSFRSDLKALSNLQKIDFKIGMLELLKTITRTANQSTIPLDT